MQLRSAQNFAIGFEMESEKSELYKTQYKKKVDF